MNTFTSKGANDFAYKRRSDILFAVFNEKMVDNLRIVDCHSSISFVIENVIAAMMPSVKIEATKCECKRKTMADDKHLPFVDINFGSDIRFLSRAAERFVMIKSDDFICVKCKAPREKEPKLNEIIFINTEKASTVALDEIPKIITLTGRIYMLAGVIQCISPTTNDFKSHFVSHVLRANRKWYIFDNSKKEVFERKGKMALSPHLLVFVLPKLLQNSPNDENRSCVLTDSPGNDLIVLRNFNINSKDGITTYVKNSCGPDSILQCLACCYTDSERIQMKWNTVESQNDVLLKMFPRFGQSKDFEEIHYMRNELYRQYYDSEIENGMETINCHGNIYEILKTVVCPSLPSIKTEIDCECGQELKNFPIIEIDMCAIALLGVTELQASIYPRFVLHKYEKVCDTCRSTQITTNYVGDVIFFNVEPLRSQNRTIGIAESVPLTDIPKEVFLFDGEFELKGVVAYVPMAGGHYVSHNIRKDSQWYQFNNLSPEVSKSPDTVHPNMLIYIKKQ